jgi:CheY-like chemotaxis protein
VCAADIAAAAVTAGNGAGTSLARAVRWVNAGHTPATSRLDAASDWRALQRHAKLKGMPPSLKPSAKPRVLLIDDDRALMERTAIYLRSKGFLVTTSENLFGIAPTIGSEHPDAIVLDVRMPALGGDKVASVLSRMCTVPIVFYSAINDDEGETLAEGHANASFVSKGAGLRCLCERLVAITGSNTSAVGL